MSDYGFTVENMLAALPLPLRSDPNMLALATAIAQALVQVAESIESVSIYPDIDKVPEDLLGELADCFKIDWWDGDYTLDEKRQVFKDSFYVHRHLGTKGAVQRAIDVVYSDTTLEEWWEYGGNPYNFRLWINLTDDDVDSDRMRKVLTRLAFYKNLRSHNDGVMYFTKLDAEPKVLAGVTHTGAWQRDDADIPCPKLEFPTYHASAGNGVCFKAIEGKSGTAQIDCVTVVPVYNSTAKLAAGAGYMDMRIDTSIKE